MHFEKKCDMLLEGVFEVNVKTLGARHFINIMNSSLHSTLHFPVPEAMD